MSIFVLMTVYVGICRRLCMCKFAYLWVRVCVCVCVCVCMSDSIVVDVSQAVKYVVQVYNCL